MDVLAEHKKRLLALERARVSWRQDYANETRERQYLDAKKGLADWLNEPAVGASALELLESGNMPATELADASAKIKKLLAAPLPEGNRAAYVVQALAEPGAPLSLVDAGPGDIGLLGIRGVLMRWASKNPRTRGEKARRPPKELPSAAAKDLFSQIRQLTPFIDPLVRSRNANSRSFVELLLEMMVVSRLVLRDDSVKKLLLDDALKVGEMMAKKLKGAAHDELLAAFDAALQSERPFTPQGDRSKPVHLITVRTVWRLRDRVAALNASSRRSADLEKVAVRAAPGAASPTVEMSRSFVARMEKRGIPKAEWMAHYWDGKRKRQHQPQPASGSKTARQLMKEHGLSRAQYRGAIERIEARDGPLPRLKGGRTAPRLHTPTEEARILAEVGAARPREATADIGAFARELGVSRTLLHELMEDYCDRKLLKRDNVDWTDAAVKRELQQRAKKRSAKPGT